MNNPSKGPFDVHFLSFGWGEEEVETGRDARCKWIERLGWPRANPANVQILDLLYDEPNLMKSVMKSGYPSDLMHASWGRS